MRTTVSRWAACLVATVAMAGSFAPSASAHATLLEPNGGELLDVGSTFTISWTITIAHDLQNWDLWYSVDGPNGPWIVLAMDLPPGSGAVGSLHTYDWTVPDEFSKKVRIRVRMDNSGTDYEDISDKNLTVRPLVLEPSSKSPNVGDAFSLTSKAFTLAGGFVGLFANRIDGADIFFTIRLTFLDGEGQSVLNAVVPPALAGHSIRFQSLAIPPGGGPVRSSNQPTVTFN